MKFWLGIQRKEFLIETTLKPVRLKCLLAKAFKYILKLLCHVTSFTDSKSFSMFFFFVSSWCSSADTWKVKGNVFLGPCNVLALLSKKKDKRFLKSHQTMWVKCVFCWNQLNRYCSCGFGFCPWKSDLLPSFHQSSPDHSTYRHNTKPTAVQQYTHSQPTDSKLLLSFPTTPCLHSQPPAKQTVLEISLQITLCLPNPPGSGGNQNLGSPCPHRNRHEPPSHRK